MFECFFISLVGLFDILCCFFFAVSKFQIHVLIALNFVQLPSRQNRFFEGHATCHCFHLYHSLYTVYTSSVSVSKCFPNAPSDKSHCNTGVFNLVVP